MLYFRLRAITEIVVPLLRFRTILHRLFLWTESITYQRLNDEGEMKRIGEVGDSITQENVVGLLMNRDEVPSASEGFTIYVPLNKNDEVTRDGKKTSVPIYKLNQFDRKEHVALCASWFVTIYKKAA